MCFYVPGTTKSRWHNPFRLAKNASDQERADSLVQYENYVRSNRELMASLNELTGAELGCWCKPNSCHGDVLVKLWCEQNSIENGSDPSTE